jgi:signal transduction histidine kinase
MFIYELSGKNILNTEYPKFEGQNLWDYKDAKGTLILQEMNKILTNENETFYKWYWEKPGIDNKQFEKIGFFKKFQPFDMFIGSGEYIDNFEKEMKEKVLEKINSIDFKAPEHIFIYNMEGLCLANPKKELIGENRYNSKNKDGEYVLRELLEYATQNKEGFIEYKGSVILNEENKTNDKISFVKSFEDWNWVIGSGFYLEEFNNIIKKRKQQVEISNKKTIEEIVIISLLITLIMIIVSFYISNLIGIIFGTYKKQINDEMQKSFEKEKLLIQQSKMAIMGEMIGSIAHQWKQPLSLILMSNGLLKLHEENKDFVGKKEAEEALENINNSVHHLSNTIDDFRNFFRPDKEKEYFYVSEAFDKTFKLINSQLKNNNIEIIKEIENLEIYTYENELLQVLINIIKNAQDELVNLNSNEKRFVFINVKKENNKVMIKIKDNAGGIPDNIINKIFDSYFTTKSDNEGTGIGLYMSKQIIDGMDGIIKVDNSVYTYENIDYKGAEFIIELNCQNENKRNVNE